MKDIIKRINELYHKAQEEGLTDEEKLEQKALKEKYIQAFRNNLTATLENTYIVDKDGNKRKCERVQKKN